MTLLNATMRLAVGLILFAACSDPAWAQSEQPGPRSHQEPRDGQRDFDWEIGTWTTKLSLLRNPLSDSSSWCEYEGTSVVRRVFDGRANLVELNVEGPAGRIEGLSLRLYNPQSRQWSLNFANSRVGVMTPPVIGEFREGVGAFFGQTTVGGRAVLVRFVITSLTPDTWRFEQSYSDDGGRTWEANWIAIDTRTADGSDESH